MVDWYKVAGVASGASIVVMTAYALWNFHEEQSMPGPFSIAIPAATGMMFLAPHKQREATLEYWR